MNPKQIIFIDSSISINNNEKILIKKISNVRPKMLFPFIADTISPKLRGSSQSYVYRR